MIAHVAHLERASVFELESRYTPEQVGLLFYIDRKRRAQEYEFSAKLIGHFVGKALGGE
jgi:hypothetical protein